MIALNRLFIISLFTVLIYGCKSTEGASSDSEKKALKYLNAVFKHSLSNSSVFLDFDNNQISKTEFATQGFNDKYIGSKIDNNTFKIVERENQGVIKNPEKVINLLKNHSEVDFNPERPIIIFYYPGLDGCSESGFRDKEWTKSIFEHFENELQKIGQTKPFYFFKHPVEKGKFEGIIRWEKDPKGAFEELFFPHHSPCGSYAIMGTNGHYYVIHGENHLSFALIIYKKIQDGSRKE